MKLLMLRLLTILAALTAPGVQAQLVPGGPAEKPERISAVSNVVGAYTDVRTQVELSWSSVNSTALPCQKARLAGFVKKASTFSKSVTLEISRAERAMYIKRKMPIFYGCAVRRLPPSGALKPFSSIMMHQCQLPTSP
jgi:hypothetical protein